MVNLLGNAIKFTQVGGVSLTARPFPGGGVELAVADTGIGLTADQAAHIFDRFFQVDDKATRRFNGLGLGVSICKELTELMGGAISVESQLDHGSTFRVHLPLPASADQPVEAALTGPCGPQPPRCFKVLLADDVPENLELASIHLLGQGHEVTCARDGQEAADLARRQPFDIILMDVQMPCLNGKDAVRLIRDFECGSGRQVPIVALSGNDGAEERQDCLRSGMTACMPKPLDFEALGALMQHLVPEGQGRPAQQAPWRGQRPGAVSAGVALAAFRQALESDDPEIIDPALERLGPAGLESGALLALRRLVGDFEFAQARAFADTLAGARLPETAEKGHEAHGQAHG